MGYSKHIAVLDLGTSGIRILVAKATEGRMPQIIAKKECPCKGNAAGRLSDPAEISAAVSSTLAKIRQSTGLIVQSLYVSIPADKISFVKNEAETVFEEEKDISNKDVGMLLDNVTDVDIYENEKLIGVAPIQYSVDGREPVTEAVGERGCSLKVFANVVLGDREYTEKVISCLSDAGVEVNGFVPMCLAMKWFIDNNCPEDSILQIDVGDTMTEYAVYFMGTPFSVGVLPIGGDFISSDIAQVYGIAKEDASVLKEEYNAANTDEIEEDREIALRHPSEDGKESISMKELVEVIQARIDDTLKRVRDGVYEDKIDIKYVDAAILTGDGMSKFRGIGKNFEDVLEMPLKDIDFGRAVGMKSYFTYACGMVLYIAGQLPLGLHPSKVTREEVEALAGKQKEEGFFKKLKNKMKKIFPGYRE